MATVHFLDIVARLLPLMWMIEWYSGDQQTKPKYYWWGRERGLTCEAISPVPGHVHLWDRASSQTSTLTRFYSTGLYFEIPIIHTFSLSINIATPYLIVNVQFNIYREQIGYIGDNSRL